ncbi:MAG: DUF120 domain-containing protein [Candidatus Hecatellaceae archaeon]
MAEPREWFTLLKLAELGALKHPIFVTTTKLSSELNCSQQTVSRWLRSLAEQGYIERRIELRGEYIKVTKKGFEALTRVQSRLLMALKPPKGAYLTIEGKVFTGLGEGAYYVSKNGYRKQFIAKLGYKPYPGTLNLKLINPEHIALRKELENLPGILIEGFHDGLRTYGSLKCLPAIIGGKEKGHVILIQRTHYDSSVVELIAPVNLRQALKLKDGSTVKVKVPLPKG